MTEAQIRVVDRSVQQMELGGVGLEGEVGGANAVEFRCCIVNSLTIVNGVAVG